MAHACSTIRRAKRVRQRCTVTWKTIRRLAMAHAWLGDRVFTRWYDGTWHAWTRLEKNAGAGEASSGLEFDVVRPPPPGRRPHSRSTRITDGLGDVPETTTAVEPRR
jgi:hypothetical protein